MIRTLNSVPEPNTTVGWIEVQDHARKPPSSEHMAISSRAKKVTTQTLVKMKQSGEKIAMLTAYDYSLARLVDNAGIDVILVGDSASNVMAGNETTVPITLEHMIYHAQCVVNGVEQSLSSRRRHAIWLVSGRF